MLASTAATNHLEALIVSAPDNLRSELRGKTSATQVRICAAMPDGPTQTLEHRMTTRALRSVAHRIQALRSEAKQLETEMTTDPKPPSPHSLARHPSPPRPG